MGQHWLSTTKYDQSLHYRFPVELVHADESLVVLYRPAGVEMSSYRGRWVSSRRMIGLYWLDDRHHSLTIMWNENFTPRMHYVNISTPVQWDGRTMSYVDLDLDVIRRAGSDRIILDDEDEFEFHARRWSYPPQLVARCRAEVEQVIALMNQRDWPYDDALFDWRPGDSIEALLVR